MLKIEVVRLNNCKFRRSTQVWLTFRNDEKRETRARKGDDPGIGVVMAEKHKTVLSRYKEYFLPSFTGVSRRAAGEPIRAADT